METSIERMEQIIKFITDPLAVGIGEKVVITDMELKDSLDYLLTVKRDNLVEDLKAFIHYLKGKRKASLLIEAIDILYDLEHTFDNKLLYLGYYEFVDLAKAKDFALELLKEYEKINYYSIVRIIKVLKKYAHKYPDNYNDYNLLEASAYKERMHFSNKDIDRKMNDKKIFS